MGENAEYTHFEEKLEEEYGLKWARDVLGVSGQPLVVGVDRSPAKSNTRVDLEEIVEEFENEGYDADEYVPETPRLQTDVTGNPTLKVDGDLSKEDLETIASFDYTEWIESESPMYNR